MLSLKISKPLVRFLAFVCLINLISSAPTDDDGVDDESSFFDNESGSDGKSDGSGQSQLNRGKRGGIEVNIDAVVGDNLGGIDLVTVNPFEDSSDSTCQTIVFYSLYGPGYGGKKGTIKVLPVVGELLCTLNPLLTNLCTQESVPGLREILQGVFSLVFYVLYRLCLDFFGFALLGLLGLDFYNNQCLLYTGPQSQSLVVYGFQYVNYTNLQDILVVTLAIGVYKLLNYLINSGLLLVLQPLVVGIASALENLDIRDLLIFLSGLLTRVIKALKLDKLLDVYIPPSFPIDPEALYTLSDVPIFNLRLNKVLFYLAQGLSILLKSVLDRLLGEAEIPCSLPKSLNTLLNDASGALGDLLGGLLPSIFDGSLFASLG